MVLGCAHSIWKFPGQGPNPCHSSDLSHCSDDAGSSTHCASRELPSDHWFLPLKTEQPGARGPPGLLPLTFQDSKLGSFFAVWPLSTSDFSSVK